MNKKREKIKLGLTLLIPSYFGLTLYTKGGSSGPPYYLINTWLYKPQILQGIRDTIQGLRKHKVCKKSFVWLPWQLFDNMVLLLIIVKTSMKTGIFQMLPETTNYKVLKFV